MCLIYLQVTKKTCIFAIEKVKIITLKPYCNTVKHDTMKLNYYKKEYSEKQWEAIVDEALNLGCHVRYSIYGNIAEIDSTDLEDRLISGRPEAKKPYYRVAWAEHIHKRIMLAALR